MQICSDAGQIEHRLDTNGTQALRIANTRALQDQRCAVDARCQDECASLERDRLALTNRVHGDSRRRLVKAIDKRAVEDGQIRQVPHRIEIGESSIPTRPANDVDGLETKAVVAVKVAEV